MTFAAGGGEGGEGKGLGIFFDFAWLRGLNDDVGFIAEGNAMDEGGAAAGVGAFFLAGFLRGGLRRGACEGE